MLKARVGRADRNCGRPCSLVPRALRASGPQECTCPSAHSGPALVPTPLRSTLSGGRPLPDQPRPFLHPGRAEEPAGGRRNRSRQGPDPLRALSHQRHHDNLGSAAPPPTRGEQAGGLRGVGLQSHSQCQQHLSGSSTRTGVRPLEQAGMGGGSHFTFTSSTVLLYLQMALVQLHIHQLSFACGGEKGTGSAGLAWHPGSYRRAGPCWQAPAQETESQGRPCPGGRSAKGRRWDGPAHPVPSRLPEALTRLGLVWATEAEA